MPGRAPGARPAVARVGGQQRFQHRASQLHDRGADRQLGRLDARAAGQGCRDAGGQLRYLGGRVRREPRGELTAEPFFCPSGSGAWPAAAGTGRASQIASLTSAICPASAANSW